MPLTLMYITNDPQIACIAQKYGVNRIWVDLETLNKEERQKNIDSVKSKHSVEDIGKIVQVLTIAEMLVRINPINQNSIKEIDAVINAGADIIMLPMWKTVGEVREFLQIVGGRVKTVLLLETKEAVDCLGEVLKIGGFDEIHIGLNDLHLSYGLDFMFELLSNGTVDRLCKKIREYNIPYGFGGIAKIGEGALPAEKIVLEHYRLGSSRVILSRSFCNTEKTTDRTEVEQIFEKNMKNLRLYERYAVRATEGEYIRNRKEIDECVKCIVRDKGRKALC